jgi:hypothetical protein
VVNFLTHHLGFPIPSPALLERIGLRFRRAVTEFAAANDIEVVSTLRPRAVTAAPRSPVRRPAATSTSSSTAPQTTLRPPLWHEAKDPIDRQKRHQSILRDDPPMDAHGLPVLLVGGIASTEQTLSPLRH